MGHAAAPLWGDDDFYTVVLQDSHGGLTGGRVVVGDAAGGEEGCLPIDAGLKGLLPPGKPGGEGFPMVGGEAPLPVNPYRFLHDEASRRKAVDPVEDGRGQAAQAADGISHAQDAVLQGDPPPGANGARAQDQAREVELILVGWGVGALHVAQFALVAEIYDMIKGGCRQGGYITIGCVNRVEEGREGGTQVEAEATAVTDIGNAAPFFLQSVLIPEDGDGWVKVIGCTF